MNPQAYILKKYKVLRLLIISVNRILVKNKNVELSSSELYERLPITIRNKVDKIACLYSSGACSASASYVGTVASMISKSNPKVIHNYNYFCPILMRKDDAFKKV